MITKVIKLDINKKMFETITAKQGDTKSRFILFNLYDGPIQFDLTGRTVRVYGKKKDNTTIFNDLVINDAKKGYCTLELTNQMLAVEGMSELELVIFEGEKRLSTMPFILNVVGSKYSEDAIVSTNEFTALMNALKTVGDIDNKAEKKEVEKLSEQLDTKANKNEFVEKTLNLDNRINNLVIPISPENVNVEVTDAHNSDIIVATFDSLKQRLGQLDIVQKQLIDDIELKNPIMENGMLSDNLSYIASDTRKSSKVIGVEFGDIIDFSNKPSNVKWKLALFSSTSISSNTVINMGNFHTYENTNTFVVNNKNIKGIILTVGKNDNSTITTSDIEEITSKIRIINFKKKNLLDINSLSDLIFENKVTKPQIKIGVYNENYEFFTSTNRFASNIINPKFGDKIVFEVNDEYQWKLTAFSDSNVINRDTVIEAYTYSDFANRNEYIIDNVNIKSIVIQGKHVSNRDLTQSDVETFRGLISILSNKIKDSLLDISNNSNTPTNMRIGTYNIGHFCEGTSSIPSGTDSQKKDFRKCLANMRCNVVALQENDVLYNQTTSETPYEEIYKNYKYYSCGTKYDYNCNAFISDYEIKNKYEKIFDNNYGQNRYYYSCDISIDGKDVHLITTQLEFQDVTTRRKQISEIIEETKKYERCIICGDFNVSNRIDNVASEPYNALYEEDYKLFTDHGLSLANVGYLGGINTLVSREGSSDGIFPWDNIVVTNNIKIKNIGRIEMEYMKDHYPIFADLVIY